MEKCVRERAMVDIVVVVEVCVAKGGDIILFGGGVKKVRLSRRWICGAGDLVLGNKLSSRPNKTSDSGNISAKQNHSL